MKRLRITIAIILIFSLMISLCSCSNATNPNDFSYHIENNLVIIDKYLGNSKNVIIPETIDNSPVYTIGEGAFKENSTLESVTIPDKVTVIGDEAFCRCTNLQSVKLSENLESIGWIAFSNCTSLHEISIPDKVKDIDQAAFIDCTDINVTMSDNLYDELKNDFFSEEGKKYIFSKSENVIINGKNMDQIKKDIENEKLDSKYITDSYKEESLSAEDALDKYSEEYHLSQDDKTIIMKIFQQRDSFDYASNDLLSEYGEPSRQETVPASFVYLHDYNNKTLFLVSYEYKAIGSSADSFISVIPYTIDQSGNLALENGYIYNAFDYPAVVYEMYNTDYTDEEIITRLCKLFSEYRSKFGESSKEINGKKYYKVLFSNNKWKNCIGIMCNWHSGDESSNDYMYFAGYNEYDEKQYFIYIPEKTYCDFSYKFEKTEQVYFESPNEQTGFYIDTSRGKDDEGNYYCLSWKE